MHTDSTPAAGLAGLAHWRHDAVAGLQVALLWTPFSLGVALASGAPAIAGLISAIVAGLLSPLLGGSHVAVSSPAAALAPVLLWGMLDGIHLPAFAQFLSSPELWLTMALVVFTFAMIDGVESVASVKAVDKIDPWRRKSDANKTLRNMCCVFSVQKITWRWITSSARPRNCPCSTSD